MLARSVAANSSVAASRSAASVPSPSSINADITINDITISTADFSEYMLRVLNNIIRNHNRLWRAGLQTRDEALAFLNRNRNNGGGGGGCCGGGGDDDDDDGPIKKKKKKEQSSITEGIRSSRRLRNLTPLLEELVNESIKLLEERSKVYVSDRLLNREYDILDHLSYFGAQDIYVKIKPDDKSSAHQSRRKKMNRALNKYQSFHGMIQTNIMDSDSDINKDIKSGNLIIYKDSLYTDAANDIITSAEDNPRGLVHMLATSYILLTYDRRSVLPPNIGGTISKFKLKSINNVQSSNGIDNTIINVTLSFPMIGRSNKRFHPNERSHGKLHKNYRVSFTIDLNNINTDQLIPINIMSAKLQPAVGETTFRLNRFEREFGDTKKYTKATMEERNKYSTIDLEDFYFCMMVDSTGSGLRLPVYINKKTYIVWALVRDYLNSDITDKAIRHANSITDNGIISGFFGELLCILVRYSVKMRITEWLVANEDIIERKYWNNIDEKKHKGIRSFLDRVVVKSSEFMKRLMKHSVHSIRKYLTRKDLGRIGWVLWGQDNAQWYSNKTMHSYLAKNKLDSNYFLLIAMLQSYDTKDEDTEEIALILSCMAENSHEFNEIYAGATFDEVMNEYARLLHSYSTYNERAFLHMSAMFVLSVFYDGKVPMDVVQLRAIHQSGIKKVAIILNTSPDGKDTELRIGKDRHVTNLVRAIIQLMEDDEIGDMSPALLDKCVDYVCRHMPDNPAGK